MYYHTIQFYNQIIEVVLFAVGILSIIKPKKNKFVFFVLSSIINIGLCYLAAYYQLRDLTLPIMLVVVNFVLLKLLKKDFGIRDVIGVVLAYTTYLICVLISIHVFSIVLNASPLAILARSSIYTLVNLALLSKFLYVFFITISLFGKYLTVLEKLDMRWKIIYLIVLTVSFIMVFYCIKIMHTSKYTPHLLNDSIKGLFAINILAICFGIFINWYKVYVEDKIKKEKELEKQKVLKSYKSDNLANLKRIKMDIDNKEHRMNYILQSIEYDLHSQSYDDAIKKINIAKELVAKIEPVIYTENEMFDFMINMEIKQLYLEHKTIKIGTFISKNDCYDEYHIWNPIVELIRTVSQHSDYFEIFIIEKNEYKLEVKLIVKDVNDYLILKDKVFKTKDNIKDKKIDNILTFSYVEKLKEI